MICLIYKNPKCLEKLFFYGGISFKVCDMKDRNIYAMWESHKNDETKKLIDLYENKLGENKILLINVEIVKKSEEIDISQENKYN